jgi:glycine oxidase
MLDYLIVGQGLAGTLLSYFLHKEGKSFAFVDKQHAASSSMVAAGIINPITGRRFVKSWRIEEMFPFALETYDDLSKILNVPIFYSRNTALLFKDIESSNNFLARSGDPEMIGYISNATDFSVYQKYFGEELCSNVEFLNSGRCDLAQLIFSWQQFINENNQIYLEEAFDYEALQIKGSQVKYKEIEASRIIFCEGASAMQNPFFNYLPFNPAKGEMLIVKIPDYPFKDKMVKDGIFIIHLKEDVYWVGSSYNRNFENSEPSEEEKNNLISELKNLIKTPFEILDHKAAVRPTVRDRKPFLGKHPDFENVYIFNGLGAKGSYLGPYFASHMVEYMEHGKPLEKDVDIARVKNRMI